MLVEQVISHPKVIVHKPYRVTAFLGKDTLCGLRMEKTDDGQRQDLKIDGAFIEIGLTPNSEALAGLIELNERGEIPVDRNGATVVEGLFAAGDVTDEPAKQIVVAGSGAKAALAAHEYTRRPSDPSILGTPCPGERGHILLTDTTIEQSLHLFTSQWALTTFLVQITPLAMETQLEHRAHDVIETNGIFLGQARKVLRRQRPPQLLALLRRQGLQGHVPLRYVHVRYVVQIVLLIHLPSPPAVLRTTNNPRAWRRKKPPLY